MKNREGNQLAENIRHVRKKFDAFLTKNKISLFTCPCCGFPAFTEKSAYQICAVCVWEDDGKDDPVFTGKQDSDDTRPGGPNHKSLRDYREDFFEKLRLKHRIIKPRTVFEPEFFMKQLGRFKSDKRKVYDQMTGDENRTHPLWKKIDSLHIEFLKNIFE